mmetsp:Transcript_2647/g.7428  ORF Transcript_2647/g.7428 Transcript_2647/m.7428 type:complete len:253 (-) Transcript_2647:236-994(-)
MVLPFKCMDDSTLPRTAVSTRAYSSEMSTLWAPLAPRVRTCFRNASCEFRYPTQGTDRSSDFRPNAPAWSSVTVNCQADLSRLSTSEPLAQWSLSSRRGSAPDRQTRKVPVVTATLAVGALSTKWPARTCSRRAGGGTACSPGCACGGCSPTWQEMEASLSWVTRCATTSPCTSSIAICSSSGTCEPRSAAVCGITVTMEMQRGLPTRSRLSPAMVSASSKRALSSACHAGLETPGGKSWYKARSRLAVSKS